MATPKLFIPRKTDVRQLLKKYPDMAKFFADEMANWLSIERWAGQIQSAVGAASQIHRTTNQTIATNTLTLLVMDHVDFDGLNIYNAGNGDFIIKQSGTYVVSASVQWNTPAAVGLLELAMTQNFVATGTAISNQSQQSNPGANTSQVASFGCHLSKGDEIQVLVQQRTGANLDVLSTGGLPNLGIIQVA